MIIYVAGLQSVPEDMLEAARIDGANGWQTLWKITIPNVMPSITICTFLTLTNSFKLYDQNLALTAGRPFIQQGGEVIKTHRNAGAEYRQLLLRQRTQPRRGTGKSRHLLCAGGCFEYPAAAFHQR